jgi:hypothetical protein
LLLAYSGTTEFAPMPDHHDQVDEVDEPEVVGEPKHLVGHPSEIASPAASCLAWQPPSTHLEPHPKIRPRELGVIATDILLPPSARVRTLDRDRTGSQPVSVLPWLAASRTR